MKEIADQLRSIIATVEPQLSQIDQYTAGIRPGQKEWSRMEILGHLIDSATNNHQRFVRAIYNAAVQFPVYHQNEWVQVQRYNERSWASLVALWSAFNYYLSDLIECIPESAASSQCNIGQKEPVPLDFVVKDYLDHMQLHLKDILAK